MKKKIGIALVALVLIFISLIIFRKDNTTEWNNVADKLATPESYFFTWNGKQCHYTLQGNGSDTIMMVHGFGGSHKDFTTLAAILEKNYTILRIDLPAFGLSEVPNVLNNPPKDMMDYHLGYFETLRTETQLDSFHLIGNSMGGMVSWYLASQDLPLKSLTLLNSAGYGMVEVKETATGWMTSPIGKWLLKKGVPLSKSKSNAEGCYFDKSLVTDEGVKASYAMNNKRGTFQWMINLATSEILPDTNVIKNIKVPTLVVWGEHDEVIPVEHADKFIRDINAAELLIYPNCGHVPQLEMPHQLAQDWQKFVHKI